MDASKHRQPDISDLAKLQSIYKKDFKQVYLVMDQLQSLLAMQVFF
jgi:hypothetical protein